MYLFILIVILGYLSCMVVGQMYLPLQIIPILSKSHPALGYPASWLVSFFGLAYAFGFLFFGPLADRFGKKRVLLGGLAVLTVVSIWVALATNGAMLLVARIVQGFVAASFPPVALALIPEIIGPPSRRQLAISAMAFGFLSAIVVAQIITILLGAQNLFRPEMVMIAGYIAAGGLLAGLLARLPAAPPQPGVYLQKTFKALPALLCNGALRRLYVATFFLLFFLVGFYVVLLGSVGATLAEMGLSPLALRMLVLPFMLSCFLAPLLVSHCSYALPVLFAGMALSFALSAVAISEGGRLILLILALCLLSFSVALAVPLFISSVGGQAPKNQRGSAIALYAFVLFCGASLAPPLVTEMTQRFGVPFSLWVFFVSSCFCIFLLTIKTRRFQ